jgi:hypothetical protein
MSAAAAQEAGRDEADDVFFVCEKAPGCNKLRVRVTSAGFHRNANCQFPRALRTLGATFRAPADAVTLVRTQSGTVYYRVKPSLIKPISGAETIAAVFPVGDDEECVVCYDAAADIVFAPCGHFCCCATCAARIEVCVMCRARIVDRVDKALCAAT